MTDAKKQASSNKDFRGLTIFEILTILTIVGGAIFWALSSKTGMQNKVYDEQRRARVTTLKENLMTLVNKNGSFPSDEEFQNDDIRKNLFSSYLADYGQDYLGDPKDSQTLITYIAEPEGCLPNTDNPCTKVTVALKLSTGEQFIKFGVKPGSELEYLNQATEEEEQNAESVDDIELVE